MSKGGEDVVYEIKGSNGQVSSAEEFKQQLTKTTWSTVAKAISAKLGVTAIATTQC